MRTGGQAWWQDAGISGSIIVAYHASGASKVRGRRVGEEMRLFVDRPVDDLRPGTGPARAAALADVDAVVALLRRRTGLGPHPELPGT